MRDVSIVATIYCFLFAVLTLPTDYSYLGFSVEVSNGIHHFFSELIFWGAALYICATGTMGAFARQDRFSLSQKHPVLNRFVSLILLLSPFLAVVWNVRFIYILLGLLTWSHIKSKTDEEKKIVIQRSRALSNIILIALFTLAMMLMSLNNYHVSSVFNFGAIKENNTNIEQKADNA